MPFTVHQVHPFFSKEAIEDSYELLEPLGKGTFSEVWRAVCLKHGSQWAVKCIPKANLPADDEAALLSEVAILEKVKHPHIIRLRQVIDRPDMFYMVGYGTYIAIYTCCHLE